MSTMPVCDCGGAVTQVHTPTCPIMIERLRRAGKTEAADTLEEQKDAATE